MNIIFLNVRSIFIRLILILYDHFIGFSFEQKFRQD